MTQMSIDLGDEQVVVERIDSVESLSTPFLMLLDVITPLEIDIHPHMGKPARVKIVDDNKVLRHFHGYVTGSDYRKESTSGHHYRLTLRPWTYFLDQNRDFAIYNDQCGLTVIKKVLEEAGISDVDYSKLSKARTPRVYCVQYSESDFAFISRLMEEEGIYYFFRHENDRHVMVMCESPNAHAVGDPASLYYSPPSRGLHFGDGKATAGPARLHSWMESVSTTADARVTMRDYDFEKPDHPLNAPTSDGLQHPQDIQELYTYPGRYVTESHGGELGKIVLDSTRALRRVFRGESQVAGIVCGTRFTITNHPVARMNASYVVISTHHDMANETYRSVADENADALPSYAVTFEAIPADTRFQAPLVTPRPTVKGLESAVITGPEGETIYTDKYGRVKVRFHWDRHGRPGEHTTCWMRVSQTGGLGNQILPRVGHEVLVDFLNGDPDRPLVVGRVFNASHMPIYSLPGNKTRALWRTLTYGQTGQYPDSKALSPAKMGKNELRFEDKGGKEEIYIDAQRDMNVRVHFDDSHHVGHNQDHLVGFNRKASVGNDEATTIARNQTEDVGKNQTRTIGEDRAASVGKNDSVEVGSSRTLNAGDKITYEAGTSIELKVKGSSIKIDATGVTITGTMIKVEGQALLEMKGKLTQLSGTAMLIMKGGLTTIN